MREKPKSLEGNLRERLLGALINMRERGIRDPEAIRLLNEWSEEIEKRVPINQPKRRRGIIFPNIERARLYRDAGYFDEAAENYKDALVQLENETNRENKGDCEFISTTTEMIYAEMDKLPEN